MIIRELYLKSFGKFSDTKIELEEGFHIFYGENEFGKSTLHAFIRSMLFGLTKGRGRAAKNDLFTKYEPWDQPSYYAGEMTFESGGRRFVISRRFDRYGKRADLVCQTDGEILSVEQGDMDMLLDGMSEAAFENTISIGQTKAETSAELGAELRNYAANYYSSGNSEMDVERALVILKERRKTVENRQKEIRQKKQEKREKVEQQAAYISEEIEQRQEEEKELERKISQSRFVEETLRKEAEKRMKKEAQSERKEREEKIRQAKQREEKNGKDGREKREGNGQRGEPSIWKVAWDEAKITLLPVLISTMLLITTLFLKGNWKWLLLAGSVILEIVFLWRFVRKFWQAAEEIRQNPEEAETMERMEAYESQEKKEDCKNSQIICEKLENQREIVRRTIVRSELLREEIAEKQMQYENLCEEAEELMEVGEEYAALDGKARAIKLAEETIWMLSTDVRKAFGTSLNETASSILREVTNGKYERIFIDENTKIYLLEGAKKISVEQVSRGTMEQIYFALRMASAELMYEEEFPVILDETFAYYDDTRLESTLRWLAKNRRQIILFTCQRREIEMLKRIGIPYHIN